VGFLDKAKEAALEARDQANEAVKDARTKAEAKYAELEESGRIDEWKAKAKDAIDQGEQAVGNLVKSGASDSSEPDAPAPADQSAAPPPPPAPAAATTPAATAVPQEDAPAVAPDDEATDDAESAG
jgi:hypothetical protein